MAGEKINSDIYTSRIKDSNNNGLKIDDLLSEFNKDSKLTKEEREEIKNMYESEKQLISTNTSQEIVSLRQKIEGILEISKIQELSTLDGFDEFVSLLTKSEKSQDFFNLMKNFQLISKKDQSKIVDNLDSSVGGVGFPGNETDLIKFISINTPKEVKNDVKIEQKEVKNEQKEVKNEQKEVKIFDQISDKNSKLYPIYEKYFGGLNDGTPDFEAKRREVLDKNLDNILKDVLELAKNSSGPEFFKIKTEVKELIDKLADSGLISKDRVVSFLKELDSLGNDRQKQKDTKDTRTSQIESLGLPLDVTKKEGSKFQTIPDGAGIKQEIKISRNGDVKRSLVSSDGGYSREVPIFLPDESIENKLTSIKGDLIVNQDKQDKLESFIKNNPEMSQEDKIKIESIKAGLISEEKDLTRQQRILESNKTIGKDKEDLQKNMIENNSKFIEFLSNTGITSLGQDTVDNILDEFERNFNTINPGKKGDFGLEKGFGIAEKELLVKGLQKITGFNFNPENGLMNSFENKTKTELLRNNFSEEPKVIDNGVLRLQGIRDRLSKQAN